MNDEEIIENLDLLLVYDMLKEEKDLGLIKELNSLQDSQDLDKNQNKNNHSGDKDE